MSFLRFFGVIEGVGCGEPSRRVGEVGCHGGARRCVEYCGGVLVVIGTEVFGISCQHIFAVGGNVHRANTRPLHAVVYIEALLHARAGEDLYVFEVLVRLEDGFHRGFGL